MINKQNLWFITLFSLIMVLSIYYLTMGDETLTTQKVTSTNNNATEVVISKNETLVALEVAAEEEMLAKTQSLEEVLLDATSTLEEKNKAYEELQNINKSEGQKATIEKAIKEKFKLDSFVKIDGTNVTVTIASKNHDTKLANQIILEVQKHFTNTMYITVKFG